MTRLPGPRLCRPRRVGSVGLWYQNLVEQQGMRTTICTCMFATRGGRVDLLPLEIFVPSMQPRNVGMVSLLGLLMTGGEGGDPSAPLGTARGRKSTDWTPPSTPPGAAERNAPRSPGGGEAGRARRSSLFLPPASPVGTGGVHRPAGTTTVRSETVEPPSDANTPVGMRMPDVAG